MDISRAALIEIGGSHDECLYSQLLFLKKGGYHVTLICDEQLRSRMQDIAIADEQLFFQMKGKKGLKELAVLNQIRRHLIDNNINTVIFNTAEGREVRNLCLMPYPAGMQFYGTMHSIRKAAGSATQKLISRKVKKYFVLNDYLVANVHKMAPGKLSFASYYPIFFPDYAMVSLPVKKDNELWVAIPGQVEYKRRDYRALVMALAALPVLPVMKFFLLGKSMHAHGDGAELKALLAEHGLTDMFVIWDGFVDNETYHTYIRNCDVVMPLLHPGNEGYDGYLNLQISGAYNAAFAYHKPLFMHTDFSRYDDFKENAVFYDIATMGATLLQLPQLLVACEGKMYKDSKWRFEEQVKRYLAFLGDH